MTATLSRPDAGLRSRIGPNAVIQLGEALQPRIGPEATRQLYERAGASAWWVWPPEHMVPEGDVARLHDTMRAGLDPALAREVSRDAGARTADYLLAHRIPKPVQAVLRVLPAPLAARVLIQAITRHAWTFAGSGRFTTRAGRPADAAPPAAAGIGRTRFTLTIVDNPLCRGWRAESPACDFYAATFERLFCTLVHAGAQVIETACEARGDAGCRFEVRWG
jgi:divinyl protochlorophyllide a 8-vinyl-reductase